jgi:stage V sporulation protein AD
MEKILCKASSMIKSQKTPVENIIKRSKNQTIVFKNPPFVIGRMSVVGQKEGCGPISDFFDIVLPDDKLKQKTFEKAETIMLKNAIDGAIKKSGLREKEIDCMIGGDLLNQITSSQYVAREYSMPFLGVYSACSTMSESLLLGSILIDGGYFNNIVCSTCSHFATAERQFRYPLEYGCQRPPYSQWTVTGAGSMVLSKFDNGDGMKITKAVIGKVVDYGTCDLNNMGASMAPACADTLFALLRETNTKPTDYDFIVSGDLGKLGSDILRELMKGKGVNLGSNYHDCGCLIYDHSQKCYQGGSGAGCSATVVSSYILEKMKSGEFSRVAYLATGALMSSQSCFQGETIPCISHAIVFER